jgi:hypothetical protein
MDSVSIVLVVLLGAVTVWLVGRAFSNARHSPPTRVSDGQNRGTAYGSGILDAEDPVPPRSRRSDGE